MPTSLILKAIHGWHDICQCQKLAFSKSVRVSLCCLSLSPSFSVPLSLPSLSSHKFYTNQHCVSMSLCLLSQSAIGPCLFYKHDSEYSLFIWSPSEYHLNTIAWWSPYSLMPHLIYNLKFSNYHLPTQLFMSIQTFSHIYFFTLASQTLYLLFISILAVSFCN